MRITLLKWTWPIWKAIDHMIAARNPHGVAATPDGMDVHVVLVPRQHTEKFTSMVRQFYEDIRSGADG